MCLGATAVINNNRLEYTDDKGEYVAVGGMQRVSVNINPASDETVLMHEGQFGMTYVMETSMSGFKVGDKIVVLNTTPNINMVIKSEKKYELGFTKKYKYVLFKGNT